MTNQQIKKLLNKRVIANALNFNLVVVNLLITFSINPLLGVLYGGMLLFFYYRYGYSIGSFIVGFKTIWQKKDIKNIFYRLIDILKYDFLYLLIGVKDFYISSCGEFEYDKKYNCIVVLKDVNADKIDCTNSYKFENAHDYFFKLMFYIFVFTALYNLILNSLTQIMY
jgi:hypothetical protein